MLGFLGWVSRAYYVVFCYLGVIELSVHPYCDMM